MNRFFIYYLFIYTIGITSVFAEPLDTDPTISKYDINLFNRAAECLSIKSSPSEKNSFISAAYFDGTIKKSIDEALTGKQFDLDIKLIEKQIKLEDKDFDNIMSSLKKYCPETLDSIRDRFKYFKYDDSIFLDSLQKQIVTVIFSEVANKNDKVKRFEENYKPFDGSNLLAY